MPRRGEHQVLPQPAPVQTVTRVGVRQVVLRRENGDRVLVLDPGQYRCSGLVAELADEWVSYSTLRGTVHGCFLYRNAIYSFAEYVDEHGDHPEHLSLGTDVPDVTGVTRAWFRALPSRFGEGSTIPGRHSRNLRALIRFRAERDDVITAESVRRLLAAPNPVPAGRTGQLDEFSRQEKRALMRAAWECVRTSEERLALGRELIAQASGHPDEHGWLDGGNLLWALGEKQLSPAEVLAGLPPVARWPQELHELAAIRNTAAAYPTRYQLLVSLVGMLYPRDEDLHAFRVLLVAATGHAPEEITGLAVPDIEFTPSGVRLTLTKRRVHKIRHRVFGPGETTAAGYFGRTGGTVAELIRRLLAVTERAREESGLPVPPLFLRAELAAGTRELVFARLSAVAGMSFGAWIKARNLEISPPWDLRRMRKSVKVEKTIAMRGVVSDIADDHTVETFLGHYAHGTTLHVVSGHVINRAQHAGSKRRCPGRPSWTPRPNRNWTNLTPCTPWGCRDSRPSGYGPERWTWGSPAAVTRSIRPTADRATSARSRRCAAWNAPTPSSCRPTSPQLLLFSDHLQALRHRLTPQHFHALWGQSQANLEAVLAERTDTEITTARRQITEHGLALQLPLSARTEFDL